jgi:hypothetical protein
MLVMGRPSQCSAFERLPKSTKLNDSVESDKERIEQLYIYDNNKHIISCNLK